MKRVLFILCTFSILLASCGRKPAVEGKAPLSVIMETDLGNDIDDAIALALLYKYLDDGKIRLLAININKNGDAPAGYADILNTWYGYPDIPVGIIRDGAECENDAEVNYAKAVVQMAGPDGKPLFAGSGVDPAARPEAVTLYRKILSSEPDSSVTIVSVGFSTNLARLLDSPADDYSLLSGEELVAKKVRLLVTMAGRFDGTDHHEYNVIKDIPAAQAVFGRWPTPVVTSPFELGIRVEYPGESIADDFTWTDRHPVVEAYKAYLPMPYDRPSWDPTAVLYAVEGGDWFGISAPGRIEVSDEGSTYFTEDPSGRHRYLSVSDTQAEAIKKHFVEMVTSRPLSMKNDGTN